MKKTRDAKIYEQGKCESVERLADIYCTALNFQYAEKYALVCVF